MANRARFSARRDRLLIRGTEIDHEGDTLRRVEEVADVSLTSLARATAEMRGASGEDVTLIELYEDAPRGPGWMRHRTPIRTSLALFWWPA